MCGLRGNAWRSAGAAPTTPSAPRIRALVVSGGCCHDYGYQAKVLMEAVSKSLPVDWTIVNEGARNSTTTRFALYEKPDWIAGFDIVVHNECSADIADPAFIRRVDLGASRVENPCDGDSLRHAHLSRGRDGRLARVSRGDHEAPHGGASDQREGRRAE